jgi:hypothetical protein
LTAEERSIIFIKEEGTAPGGQPRKLKFIVSLFFWLIGARLYSIPKSPDSNDNLEDYKDKSKYLFHYSHLLPSAGFEKAQPPQRMTLKKTDRLP